MHTLLSQIHFHNLPAYETEYRFARDIVGHGVGIRSRLQMAGLKDWRFDIAWPALKFAVEIEGGAWIFGRHNRAKGFHADLIKYGTAMEYGWIIYRCDHEMIQKWQAIQQIEKIIHNLTNK